jgi:hypothetical protein
MCNFGFHPVGEVRVVIVIPTDRIKRGQTNDHNVNPFCLQRLPLFALEASS